MEMETRTAQAALNQQDARSVAREHIRLAHLSHIRRDDEGGVVE